MVNLGKCTSPMRPMGLVKRASSKLIPGVDRDPVKDARFFFEFLAGLHCSRNTFDCPLVGRWMGKND